MPVQPKLLYISWIIPPAAGGSAFVTHQLAKHFDSNELVLVGGCRKPFQGMKMYDGVQYNYFFTELNWRGHGDRYFSLLRWLLFPFFLFNLFRLTSKEKPQAVLATFPDGYYLLASWIVARCFKLKFFSYFHNTYTDNRNGISKWFASKIQQRVFRDSKIIFLISEGMLAYYQNQYPSFLSKFEVLPHTFDHYPSISHSATISEGTVPYKLVMIGTFNNSNMEATLRLLTIISRFPLAYQVTMYTSVNKRLMKYKWGLDFDLLGIKHSALVNREELEQVISSADACLLTHGFTGEYTEIEYQTIFPTRMIPLLLSGKPILAHSPDNSFLNKFIRKYDCAELVSEKEEDKIISALKRVTEDQNRRKQLVENSRKASAYFYGPAIAKSLIKSLISRMDMD